MSFILDKNRPASSVCFHSRLYALLKPCTWSHTLVYVCMYVRTVAEAGGVDDEVSYDGGGWIRTVYLLVAKVNQIPI